MSLNCAIYGLTQDTVTWHQVSNNIIITQAPNAFCNQGRSVGGHLVIFPVISKTNNKQQS